MLTLPLKQRQADAGANRKHVPETRVASLVAGLKRPVGSAAGARQVQFRLGPPIPRAIGPEFGQIVETCAQDHRPRGVRGRQAFDAGIDVARPSGQDSARRLALRHQFAATIVKSGFHTNHLQGRSGPISARRHAGRNRVPERFEGCEDILQHSQLAIGVIEIDPGQTGGDPDLPERHGAVGNRHADGGFREATFGATARPAGKILFDPNPQRGEIVIAELSGEGAADRKPIEAEGQARIGQLPCCNHRRLGGFDAQGGRAQVGSIRGRAV